MARYALVIGLALCSLGGLHCGMSNEIGPVVHQPLGHYTFGAPSTIKRVRIKRADGDFRSAELVLTKAPDTTVRTCDGHEVAFVRGGATVPIAPAPAVCIEIDFAEAVAVATVELRTDVGRKLTIQSNCSPHGGPYCMGPSEALMWPSVDGWKTWTIEVVEPAPR